MDLYLPADFHLLHDDAAADWRDLPAPPLKSIERCLITCDSQREIAQSADPSWLAI